VKLAEEVRLCRLRGYATERHEFSVGIVGVGVPVMVAQRPVGVVAVVAPSVRCGAKRMAEIGLQLSELMTRKQQEDGPEKTGK
jgi:DNA-binding IclR family transcriptional regulator